MARTVRSQQQRLAETEEVCRLYDNGMSIADIVRRVPLVRSTVSLIVYRRRADGRALDDYLATLRPARAETAARCRARELARERQRRRRARLRLDEAASPGHGRRSARDRELQRLHDGLRENIRDRSVRRRILLYMEDPAPRMTHRKFSAWTLDAIASLLRSGDTHVQSRLVPTSDDIKEALQAVLLEWEFRVDAEGAWHVPRE